MYWTRKGDDNARCYVWMCVWMWMECGAQFGIILKRHTAAASSIVVCVWQFVAAAGGPIEDILCALGRYHRSSMWCYVVVGTGPVKQPASCPPLRVCYCIFVFCAPCAFIELLVEVMAYGGERANWTNDAIGYVSKNARIDLLSMPNWLPDSIASLK